MNRQQARRLSDIFSVSVLGPEARPNPVRIRGMRRRKPKMAVRSVKIRQRSYGGLDGQKLPPAAVAVGGFFRVVASAVTGSGFAR